MIAIWKWLIISVMLTTNMTALAFPQGGGIPYAPSNDGLARLIMNAHLSGTNSDQTTKCFGEYIQKSNSISSKYGAEYESCKENSRNARSRIDMDLTSERSAIISEAEGICKRLTHCNSMENSLLMYNCHTEVGSNNTQSSYIISANASDYASILEERYRTISLREDTCCSKAQRSYVENTSDTFEFLQTCLESNEIAKPIIATTPESIKFESTTDGGWKQSTTSKATNTPRPITTSTATATESSHSTEDPSKSSSSIPEVTMPEVAGPEN